MPGPNAAEDELDGYLLGLIFDAQTIRTSLVVCTRVWALYQLPPLSLLQRERRKLAYAIAHTALQQCCTVVHILLDQLTQCTQFELQARPGAPACIASCVHAVRHIHHMPEALKPCLGAHNKLLAHGCVLLRLVWNLLVCHGILPLDLACTWLGDSKRLTACMRVGTADPGCPGLYKGASVPLVAQPPCPARPARLLHRALLWPQGSVKNAG